MVFMTNQTMKCKDCKNWDELRDSYGDCKLFETWGEVHDNKTYDKVVHSYDHKPVTFANFGCIHFESKHTPENVQYAKEVEGNWCGIVSKERNDYLIDPEEKIITERNKK